MQIKFGQEKHIATAIGLTQQPDLFRSTIKDL